MRVLADLDNTEEAVAADAQLPVDLGIDLEGHGAALGAKLFKLVVEGGVETGVVSVVDPDVEDAPVLGVDGPLKVPVAHHVGGRVAIAERVVCWQQTALGAQVNAKEGEGIVFSAAV